MAERARSDTDENICIHRNIQLCLKNNDPRNNFLVGILNQIFVDDGFVSM